jgi:hypothetical protein
MKRHDFRWLEPFRESDAIVYLKDRDDALLWVNDTFRSLFSDITSDLIGMRISELADCDDHRIAIATNDQKINAMVLDDGIVHEEVRAIYRKDETRWFHAKHSRVSPDRTNGKGPCILLNAVDVTARVELTALEALIGMHHRDARPVHGDEAFVRLLLSGHGIRDLSTALNLSVESVTAKLSALAGTPIR